MDIKECFQSRWAGGVLLEADFSQLEVVGLAILSGDPVLTDDITSGVDMHRLRAAELFGVAESAVTSEQRRIAKGLSFQLQYGAGAASMAEKNGVSLEIAQKFILNYYGRYARVKEWQEEVRKSVYDSRVPSGEHSKLGYPVGYGTYVSSTGRMYKFKEYDTPEFLKKRGTHVGFSPTEMKNYPVQGFATADVMALYRAMLYRKFLRLGSYSLHSFVPINSIHDSVMFDCMSVSVVWIVSNHLQQTAKELPEKLEELWGIKTDLTFPIEIKIGPNWAEMKKL